MKANAWNSSTWKAGRLKRKAQGQTAKGWVPGQPEVDLEHKLRKEKQNTVKKTKANKIHLTGLKEHRKQDRRKENCVWEDVHLYHSPGKWMELRPQRDNHGVTTPSVGEGREQLKPTSVILWVQNNTLQK